MLLAYILVVLLYTTMCRFEDLDTSQRAVLTGLACVITVWIMESDRAHHDHGPVHAPPSREGSS